MFCMRILLSEVSDSVNYNGATSFSIIESSDFIIDLWESGGWLNTLDGYDFYDIVFLGTPDRK